MKISVGVLDHYNVSTRKLNETLPLAAPSRMLNRGSLATVPVAEAV